MPKESNLSRQSIRIIDAPAMIEWYWSAAERALEAHSRYLCRADETQDWRAEEIFFEAAMSELKVMKEMEANARNLLQAFRAEGGDYIPVADREARKDA